MPTRRSQRVGGRKGKGKKRNMSVDEQMIDMARATGSTTNVLREDFLQRRQDFNLVQTPPKNWMTSIHWYRMNYDGNISTSTSGPVESNFAFTISLFNNYSAILGAFDQYCIYSITVTLSVAGQAGIYAYTNPIQVYTAIDYDNVSNIGVGGIQGFSSQNVATISIGSSLVRTVKPCIATVINNTASAFNGNGIARAWVDSAYTNIPHYGLRMIIKPTNNASSLEYSVSALCGFRNNI